MEKFIKVKSWFDSLLLGVAMFLIAEMAILLLIQIFCRFCLNSPLFWVEEILRLSQIWIVFLACPLVFKRAEHPGFRLVPQLLPFHARKGVWVFSMLLVVLVGACMGTYGIILCKTSTFTSANGIPRYWAIIPVIIGGYWTVVEALCKIAKIVSLNRQEAETWKA